MSLTPADVHGVTFRSALRGYSTRDVDAFLDRVAAALGALQEENATLRAVLASVDPDAAAGPGPSPAGSLPRALPGETGEEAALRTLVLAQRRADQAVAEGRAEAARLVAAACAEADEARVREEERLRALESELETRRAEALADLEEERSRLEAEVAQLQAFEREYRVRLRAHLEAQIREIEGGRGDDDEPAPA